MNPSPLQTLIDAAEDLIAVIDGTTDQFEDDVSRLAAVSEKNRGTRDVGAREARGHGV